MTDGDATPSKGSCDSAMSGPGGIVPVVPRPRGARCVHAWMESRA